MRGLNHPTNTELPLQDQLGDDWNPLFDHLEHVYWCDGHQRYCHAVYGNKQTREHLCDEFFHCTGSTCNGSVYTVVRIDKEA